jgi:hypothetical protein
MDKIQENEIQDLFSKDIYNAPILADLSVSKTEREEIDI